MELPIINIGNSKGIRIPETLLEKYNFGDKIELILAKEYIILKPRTEPRKGWGIAFKKMHQNEDDRLLINDAFADEHFEE